MNRIELRMKALELAVRYHNDSNTWTEEIFETADTFFKYLNKYFTQEEKTKKNKD